MFFPVEGHKVISLLAPAADAGGRTGAYVSLKNVRKAAVYFYINQGAANTVALSVLQATAISGSPAGKALSQVVPIWSDEACATNDTMVAQTAAAGTYTTSAATTIKLVCFLIDPKQCMDVAGGYDCLYVTTGASNASNITAAWIECDLKYAQAIPPTVVAD